MMPLKGGRVLQVGGGGRKAPYPTVDNCAGPQVDLVVDFRKPLPYLDGSWSVIICAYVIERISVDLVFTFLNDLHRVLRPGGMLRVIHGPTKEYPSSREIAAKLHEIGFDQIEGGWMGDPGSTEGKDTYVLAFKSINGTELYPAEVGGMPYALYHPDFDCVSVQMAKGQYEPFEMEILLDRIHVGDKVIDVGAHIGYYTIPFVHKTGSTGRVDAFEPDPMNFIVLSRNVTKNNLHHIIGHRTAVGDMAGRGILYNSMLNTGDNRLWEDNGCWKKYGVSIVRLDDVIKEPVQFIKIDTQGAECQVLRGAKEILVKNPKLTLAVEFWPHGLIGMKESVDELMRLLEGFDIFNIDEKAKLLMKIDDPRPLVTIGTEEYANLLCVKKEVV